MKKALSFLIFSFYLQASSQPIFVTISGGNLYSLNLSTCSSRFVGPTGHGFGDIAFTPDGKLWGIEGGILYKIDTTNANTTMIGTTGTQAVSLVALNNTILLAEYGQNLYGINTINATSYLIGHLGYTASGDLTWYDNDLYMTASNLLIKIVSNSSFSSISSVTKVNSDGNNIPTCEGAVTAPFIGFDNSIIGFSGGNAYKICQIDGSSQLLCASIVPAGIPGAATLTLPTQNPKPQSCFGSTPQTQNPPIRIIQNTNQIIIVTNPGLDDATLIVFNMLGQKVRQLTNITSTSVTVNHENLASGVYVFRIIQRNRDEIVKKLPLFHN